MEQFAHSFPSYPVCIHINPHIMGGGHSKIKYRSYRFKFGISYHQLPHVLRLVDMYKIPIEGVHMHTGSDILDIDVFLQGAEILFGSGDISLI